MKKFVVFLLFILSLFSTGFMIYNIRKYNEISNKLVEKQNQLKKINENILVTKENKKTHTKEYEELENKNKEKVEEYEKWKKEVQKIKDLLS